MTLNEAVIADAAFVARAMRPREGELLRGFYDAE